MGVKPDDTKTPDRPKKWAYHTDTEAEEIYELSVA
jgi:hypothetical protein